MERRDWSLPLLWLGIAGLLCVLLGGVYMGGHSAGKIQAKVQARASEALAEAGYSWATAEAEGQKVTLTGFAPSEQAREDAVRVAKTAIGPGGVVAGGVTKVVSRLDVAAAISPYVWQAQKADGELTLLGHAPSRSVMDEIVVAAERAYPGRVINQMSLGTGAPEGGNWADIARFGLSQLEGLDPGRATLTDTELSIEGEADSIAVLDDIAVAVSAISAPFSARSYVSGPYQWAASIDNGRLVLTGFAPDEDSHQQILHVARRAFDGDVVDRMGVGGERGWTGAALIGLPHFVKFNSGQMSLTDTTFSIRGEAPESVFEYLGEDMARIPAPYEAFYDVNIIAPALTELEGLDLAASDERVQEAACQDAFVRIMSANQIYFATAKADITRKSGQTLDKLVAVARQCANLNIVVEGHTDNRGGRALNISLSRKRAEAVKEYLVSKGLRREQLEAVGYGPDRPADTNSTIEGRANNRRIEFKVTSEGDR